MQAGGTGKRPQIGIVEACRNGKRGKSKFKAKCQWKKKLSKKENCYIHFVVCHTYEALTLPRQWQCWLEQKWNRYKQNIKSIEHIVIIKRKKINNNWFLCIPKEILDFPFSHIVHSYQYHFLIASIAIAQSNQRKF